MKLRPATNADVDVILALWRGAAAEPSVSDDADGIRGLLERDPEGLLVAEQDGHIVGTLAAAWDGWRGHLYRLAVHPDHRRRGIGGALVAEGEHRLRAKGARKIQGIVLADSAEARAFWETVGYVWDERVVRHAKTIVP